MPQPNPPAIDAILASCKEAVIQNTILNISLAFLAFSLLLVVISVLSGSLPATAVYGFAVVLAIALAFRVIIRSESKVSLKGLYRPGQGDSFAQIMRVAFKSEDVRYSTGRSPGTDRAFCTSRLPFPLLSSPGMVSFKFGRIEIVPITDYVLVFKGMSVKAVPDEGIAMRMQTSSRTVSMGRYIPSDASITRRAWRHMTVKGLPDRRYSDNPGEVTYQFGVIAIAAKDVFALSVSFSRWSAYGHINEMLSKRGGGNPTRDQAKAALSTSMHVQKGTFEDYTSLVAAASRNLVDYVRELSQDRRGMDVMGDVGGLEEADRFAQSCRFNPRFAMLLYRDALAVFRDLGWSTDDLKGLEGLGLLFLVGHLFNVSIDVDQISDPAYSEKLAPIVSRLVKSMGFTAAAEGRDDPLLLHLVLNQPSGDREWAMTYATLMYRWASVIAKADGTITVEESNCLAGLMKLKDETSGCNVRVSGDSAGMVGHNDVKRSARQRQKRASAETFAMPDQTFAGLIGLQPVRKEVAKLSSFIEIQRMRASKGLRVAEISYHCVFTGNPGTGKTTVARIVADIYRRLGILKKGHLVETDRSGLVAEYVGQTAVKTNKVIDSALDGVLFIDEAYSLVGGGKEDYGKEAIATLLKRMEDDRDRLVVILAGYTREIKAFIDSNPGLQSRFNRYVEFPDYSAQELTQIFLSFAKRGQYRLAAGVHARLDAIMAAIIRDRDKNFGNARFVRNLFEKTIECQALRLSSVAPITTEMLETIEMSDLEGGRGDVEPVAARALDGSVGKMEEGRYVIE